MNKNIFLRLFLTLFAISTLLEADHNLQKVSIQLKWFYQYQFAGIIMAKEKGFYKNVGLDVLLKERDPKKNNILQVINGESEYGVADSVILRYRANGHPLKILATIFQHNAMVLISKKESNIISPYEMKGKSISFQEGLDDSIISSLLKFARLDKNDYIKKPMDFTYMSFINGSVDIIEAYISIEPYWLKKKYNIDVNLIDPKNYGIDFYGDLLFTTEKEIQEHPQRVKNFKEATLKGWKYAMTHKDETINTILQKYNTRKLTYDQLMYEARITDNLIASKYIKLGDVRKERFKILADLYQERGMTKEQLNNAVETIIYDTDYQHSVLENYFYEILYFSIFLFILVLFLVFYNRRLNFLVKEKTIELHNTLKIAKKSELKFHTIFESSLDGIALVDMKTQRFIEYNSMAYKMYGYTKEEFSSLSIIDLDAVYDETQVKEYQEAILEKGWGRFETKHKAKDGSLKDVFLSVVIIFIEEEPYLYSTFHDITQAKINESKLKKAKDEAQKANKAKSDFLSNMSHEIRTPLNGILGLTNMLFKTELSDKQREYLQKSKASSSVLLYLINDILDYSKIEAGKLQIENKPFKLNTVIKNVKDLFEYQITDKGLLFNINSIDNIVVVGDSLRLLQVLVNLLGNALKFTSKGFIDFDIKALEQNKEEVLLSFCVKDSGIGMSQEVQKKLFGKFMQADTSITRKYGGTGLGLAISKRLVNLMDGDIYVKSDEGIGSEFCFKINFKLAKYSKELELQDENILDRTLLSGANVLLVEDNEINQIVALGILEELNINVEIANNGKEALSFIEDNKVYDLILMDLQMPVMDGYKASIEIKKINKDIPIIALSAAVMQEDIAKVYNSQMSAHLAKPIDEVALVKTFLQFIKPKKSENQIIKHIEPSKEQIGEFYGVDIKELKNRVGNKPKIIHQLLRKFCDDYKNPEQIFDIKAKEFDSKIHTLKGVSGNLSLKAIHILSKEIYESIDNEVKNKLTNDLIDLIKISVYNITKLLSTIEQRDKNDTYTKEDMLSYLNKISDDIKNFKAISQDRIEIMEDMLHFYVNSETIKVLIDLLLGYRYKEAEALIEEIYNILVNNE